MYENNNSIAFRIIFSININIFNLVIPEVIKSPRVANNCQYDEFKKKQKVYP